MQQKLGGKVFCDCGCGRECLIRGGEYSIIIGEQVFDFYDLLDKQKFLEKRRIEADLQLRAVG